MSIYQLFRPFIFCLEPELAHNLAIKFLKYFPKFSTIFAYSQNYQNLKQNIHNLEFKNPIGLAGGFDKNCEIFDALANFGFGFIESGTVTPRPQEGNPRPRIFRLKKDEAIINRLGFNNGGSETFLCNVKSKKSKLIGGINIGKNKDSISDVDDYLELLEKFYNYCHYITVNISSPNTKNLRNIQKIEYLADFVMKIQQKQNDLAEFYHKKIPIFFKIAPDLDIEQQKDIANLAISNDIDGIIISNTTISRDFSLSSYQDIKNDDFINGGLSGRPLFKKSNDILANFYRLTSGKITLIGVGGIANADDAYQKIRNGASLLQIYTAFIYQGFGLVADINNKLSKMLEKDGFGNISEAVGIDVK